MPSREYRIMMHLPVLTLSVPSLNRSWILLTLVVLWSSVQEWSYCILTVLCETHQRMPFVFKLYYQMLSNRNFFRVCASMLSKDVGSCSSVWKENCTKKSSVQVHYITAALIQIASTKLPWLTNRSTIRGWRTSARTQWNPTCHQISQ